MGGYWRRRGWPQHRKEERKEKEETTEGDRVKRKVKGFRTRMTEVLFIFSKGKEKKNTLQNL